MFLWHTVERLLCCSTLGIITLSPGNRFSPRSCNQPSKTFFFKTSSQLYRLLFLHHHFNNMFLLFLICLLSTSTSLHIVTVVKLIQTHSSPALVSKSNARFSVNECILVMRSTTLNGLPRTFHGLLACVKSVVHGFVNRTTKWVTGGRKRRYRGRSKKMFTQNARIHYRLVLFLLERALSDPANSSVDVNQYRLLSRWWIGSFRCIR